MLYGVSMISAGVIFESCVYDAYGDVTIKNSGGNVISSSAYGNRFLFRGRPSSGS